MPPVPPTVLTNVRVEPMGGLKGGDAIAFDRTGILAVGRRADVMAAVPDAQRLDRSGCTVTPGFCDAHHHVCIAALYGGVVRLEAPRVHDIPSLQAALAEASRTLPPGHFLVAMGWDEQKLRERRAPTLAELDDAVPDRPLFALHYSCHRALANGVALKRAGIDAHTSEPSGGAIVRGRGNAPTGLLLERGMSRVEALARPDLVKHDGEGILGRMKAHYRSMVRLGITRIVDTAVPRELYELYRESARRGDVLVPTHVCPVSTTGYLEEPQDALDGPTTGHSDGGVDGPLIVGPVKLVFDGAPACSMCLSWWQTIASSVRAFALAASVGSLDPVRTVLSVQPRMGVKVRSGIAIYRREEASRVMREVVARGFSLATHALGNEALDVALTGYESVGTALHAAGTPRVEHAMFADGELARRMAGAGVAAVMQPAMLAMPTFGHYVSIPGLSFIGLRMLADTGVNLVGSSDYPVDVPDPLVGIRVAVTRHNARGVALEPEQALTLHQALAMYTENAAKVVGYADRSGTLAVGKRADLAVIDGFEGKLEHAKVRATYVAGEALFDELSPAS